MTKPVLVNNFDPIGQFKSGVSLGRPWDSIVDFATHKSFCGKRLYPRQMTLLKLMHLETETMTDYDLDVINQWALTFKDFNHPVGVQPDIWDRINYLKNNGFTHFPHIQMVMGRRASKGILGGIVGAERVAYLYSLGSWQQHFNQVPGQVAEVVVVANSLSQAVTRQFRDIRNTVLNCEYLRQHVVSDKQTEFYVRTPGDEQTIEENRLAGISTEREIATIYCKASSSVSTSGRGGTTIAVFYDEMAHMLAGTGSAKTGEEIYCLDPATRVLCSDLVWRPIGELEAGQKVVGYDEYSDKPGVGGRRRLREATIKHVWRNRSEAVRLNFLDGSSVVCSPNHHWLRVNSVQGGGHNAPRWAAVRAHPRPGVRQARPLRPGDHIKFLVEPWDVDDTRDGGWLAGLYDGEGHITATDVSRRVTLTQNEGAVLDKARRILKDFGFEFYDHSKSDRDCRVLEIGRLEQCLRLLGQIRPERLFAKQKGLWEGRTISNAQSVKTIESIEWLPEQELVDIETTTGTFVAEGLISHNTSFQPSLDQFGPAALTYLASSPFSKIGQFYDLYQQGRITMDEYNAREGKMRITSFAEEAAVQDINIDSDDLAAVAEPTFLVVQLPSWETYRDWDRSREIPVLPGRTRCFPRWNSPVQFEPKEDGNPDERLQYRRMRRNPDKFSVERGAQFATVQDAYLNEVMVDRMFAPPDWRPRLEHQHQGILALQYRAHADPSRTNANFGFCIGHLEDAPPDEHGIVWPHVIIDVLHVWKPEDFPEHVIDYVSVGEQLDDYLVRFPSMVKMSYDQFNCQSGDTLISTGYGMLRLDEIIGDIPDRTGIGLHLPVRSKDTDAVAEQGYHKGVVPTRKITTKLGTTLNVTPEHRLWTRKGREKPWQKDGEWGYSEASEIAVGDWLCVKRNTCMVDEEVDLTAITGWAESWGVQRHAREWTPVCDESLGEALGLLVAEGDYRSGQGTKYDHVRFGNSDDEVLERYRMLMEKSFGGTWRSQTTDEWKGKYHYGWVRKAGVVPSFLGRLGLTGTATDKVIPWVVYRSPAPVIRSFLRGYFEGDGGVIFGREGEAWVSACSTSEEVATGIQQLLMSVGVFCTLWSGNYRYKGETRPQWRVLMYGQDALDFARLVGFSSTRKRQELSDAVAMIEARQTGNIRSKNQRHGDEYWVRITGIEESQADCYEISVPGPESYIANGMVSHNSAGFIAHQKRAFPNIRILEKTFTVRENQDRFEKFKSALNLGWVHCLAGETNVLTPDGPRPIRDLAGTTARLLTTSQNDGKGGGKWVNAPVQSFGVQPLMRVTLRRNGVDKIIHATAGHRWFVRTTQGTASRRDEVLTADLKPGQKLSYCYAQRHKATHPSPIGIAHGFTYGDGTRSRKGSVAQFCGDKDKALIPYFDLHPIVDIAPGVRRALDLPRFFKEKVDLTESPSYLYGWLAGYMAADGHVTKDGRVEIDSNDRSSIEHVRAVCNVLGIHTTTIRTKGAYGHGYKPDGQGYATNLDPAALTEEFFLTDEHRRRWVDSKDTTRKDYRGYTVVSVEETDRVEEVFCAVVEGTHSFTLEDNILTGNCYRDQFAEEGQSLLELELKFLQEKNGKVDRQEIGPVQTKDLADAVMVVTTELLHESLDRWWTAINRTSVGSTNVDGLRSGREQERLLYHQQDKNTGWSSKSTYTDPLQRYLAEEADRNERRAVRAERNKATLEQNKAERARRNAFGSRSSYTGTRTRGQR